MFKCSFCVFLISLLLYRQLKYVSNYVLFFRSRSPSTTSSSMGGQDFGSSKPFLHYIIPEIGHNEIVLNTSKFNTKNKPSLKDRLGGKEAWCPTHFS